MLSRFLVHKSRIAGNAYRCFGSKSFTNHLNNELNTMKEAGTFKSERVISTAQSSSIGLSNRSEPVLNFCANNYLGLAHSDKLEQAAHDTSML